MIPISLLVNLEVVRAIQILFIKCNKGLTSEERDIRCSANNTSINEELGEVKYIMTDKTGTLTKNKMTLKGVFVADRLFGRYLTDIKQASDNEALLDEGL